MKILHYSLGFPPYRTGGLTKFCINLMKFQESQNIEVCMLWPGRMKFFTYKPKIIKTIDKLTNLKSYELVNPLPVPLDEGIKKKDIFIKDVEEKYYFDILKEINPDFIHVHTLMGIHKAFFTVAKKLNITLIYTPHDYFGLCPRVTFYNNGKLCSQNFTCKDCVNCNNKALSLRKIYMLQNPLYKFLKNSNLVKLLRRCHREHFFEASKKNNTKKTILQNKDEEYLLLRKHYIEIIQLFDIVHFNSNLTKDIFSRYIKIDNSKVINITHNDIKDNRKIKKFDKEILRITYMAGTKPYKGFNILIDVLDEIWNENIQNFKLNVFGNTRKKRTYMNVKERYTSNDLKEIFENTDVLIVPSIWYETYGFTVLEAISYGVPVIVTKNVGAKDIIGKAGIIIEPNNFTDLKKAVKTVIKDRNVLKEMNKATFQCILPNMENMLTLLEGKR